VSSGSTRKKIHPETLAGGGGRRLSGVVANRPKRRLNFYRPTFFSFTVGGGEDLNCEEGSIKTDTTPTRKSAAQHPLRPPGLLVLTSSGGGYTQHDDDSAAAVFHIATPFFFLTLSTPPLYFLKIFQFYRFGGRKCCLFPF